MTDLNISLLVERVSKYFSVTPQEIFSKSREKKLVIARDILYLHLRNNGYTYHRIALSFGKTHATIIHGTRYAKENLMVDYSVIFA